MNQPCSTTNRAKSRQVCPVTAVLAIAIWVFSPVAMPAALAEHGVLELQYKEGMQRVVPSFEKNYGKYLGSGVGELKGALKGSVVWDLYEEQSDPRLHRTQFVGRITAPDGSEIDFETTGYFIPRQGDAHFWDLTSATHFSDAKGKTYRRLAGRVGLLEGYVHVVDASTYVHTYTLYFPGT